MSAHCDTCGADIVYPQGTWPLGTCQVCDLRQERDDLQARNRELAEALRLAQDRWYYRAQDWRERAERAEAALRESATTYHRHMQHPRDFEVCTWKPCRVARAALTEEQPT